MLTSKKNELENIKLIIFDLDGTLYKLNAKNFLGSLIYRDMRQNSINFLKNKLNISENEAKNIFEKILINYNYEISIGLEKEFNINRYEYFGFAWNLDANKYIKQNKKLKHILALLSTKYKLAVVTDAPKIWAEKVLIRLDIIKMFRENIFTGESNIRKSFGNAFLAIAKHLGVSVSECVVVGDDKQNDIDFAKEIGMKTIYIGDEPYEQSDYSIKDVCEIDKIFGALT